MIYYMIRHKATGEFMPELRRTRGYSHWNPNKYITSEHLRSKLLGVPRLFYSRGRAYRCIVQWNAIPNGKMTFNHHGPFESEEYELDIKLDDRKKEDLEIIEVEITERTNEPN